jgi:hypothetical protein
VARRIGIVILPVLEIEIAQRIAMDAIEGEDEHHGEIGEQDRRIKPIPVVEPLEGLVSILHFQVVEQAVMGRKSEIGGNRHGRPMQLAGGGIQTVGKGGKQGEPPGSGYRQL